MREKRERRRGEEGEEGEEEHLKLGLLCNLCVCCVCGIHQTCIVLPASSHLQCWRPSPSVSCPGDAGCGGPGLVPWEENKK